MNKEEAKQYIRNQIDSCVKEQSNYDKDVFYLCYNKQYLRALKLSTITGNLVNKKNFKGGEKLLMFNTKNEEFWIRSKISDYLEENFSNDYIKRYNIIKEVIKEYDEYKDYKAW